MTTNIDPAILAKFVETFGPEPELTHKLDSVTDRVFYGCKKTGFLEGYQLCAAEKQVEIDALTARIATLEQQRQQDRAVSYALPPLTLTTSLTVVMTKDVGDIEADAAIEAVKNGDTVLRVGVSELFFSQLRLRAAQDPSLLKKIAVLYKTPRGYEKVGLLFEDEPRWPEGFLNDLWEKEGQIQAARAKEPSNET